jgi:hypothetical protein
MSSNDPVPVNSRKSGDSGSSPSSSRRFKNAATNSAVANPKDCSLIYLCRSVIIANLERYPPDSLGIVSEEEWESIIRLRHRRTSPKAGSGGLDGTGRIAPALSDRFLAEVEQANPRIAESAVVDQLVWKDCVEYKFKMGGMTRPKSLTYPWPILVEKIRRTGDVLATMMEKNASERDEASIGRVMDKLIQFPMNIALLKATGIGKSIKHIIKSHRGESESPVVERLKQLLTSWMDLAASNGVKIKGQNGQAASSPQVFKDDEEDLRILETCPMWRHLFAALTQREQKRRSDQGKRMREKRKDRASGRPKVVKVRPASAKHDRILARPAIKRIASMSGKSSPVNGRMLQLKKEASLVASRQGKLAAPVTVSTGRYGAAVAKSSGGFGAAVAFSSGSKKNSNAQRKKDGRSFEVGGGKRMQIPATAGQGASRNLVAKMKKLRK